MGELMTKHMWNERSQEVNADTKKSVVQIVERYKTAYSYCILQQLRKNLSGKNEQSLLLEQRKWQNYNRPLHSGSLYVVGNNDHRKWRRRYCVLQPDYTLEVYDSKEDFEAANRPRFARKFSNFDVVDNVDAHLSQLVKDYLKDFGFIRDNVSDVVKKVGMDPSKRPTQHVLALHHKYRGTFYMAADSAVEKDKWLKTMEDAQRQLSGVHCENRMQQEAFEFAIRQACIAEEHCGISVNMSGTQEEIASDFITDYLSNGCKTMLQTKVKGDVFKKYRMWGSISKHLAESVEGIVNVEYPPLRKKAETEAEEMKQKMMYEMPQINAVYETVCAEIIGGLDSNFTDDMEMKILPKIPDMVTRMGDSMSGCLREVRDVFVSLSESVQRQVNSTSPKFANNIDTFLLSHLDIAPRNPEVMQSTFQAAIGKKSPFAVLSETFPKLQYSQHEAKLCVLLQKLLDSAICTFEVLCGEVVSKNDGHLQAAAIAKIEGRVLKKLTHDNGVLTKRFLNDLAREIAFNILRHIIYHDNKNKLRDYEDFVPSEFAAFMPAANLFRNAVYDKLEEELRPSLTAAFKRLAHDHYNMVRYHSSSTINSHSSNASDDTQSSSKHDSPASQASPPRTNLEQKAPVVEVNPTREDNIEKPDQEEKVHIETETSASEENNASGEAPCDLAAGYIMDGETGECFEQVDENGEFVTHSGGQNTRREKEGKEELKRERDAGNLDSKIILEEKVATQEPVTEGTGVTDENKGHEAPIEQEVNPASGGALLEIMIDDKDEESVMEENNSHSGEKSIEKEAGGTDGDKNEASSISNRENIPSENVMTEKEEGGPDLIQVTQMEEMGDTDEDRLIESSISQKENLLSENVNATIERVDGDPDGADEAPIVLGENQTPVDPSKGKEEADVDQDKNEFNVRGDNLACENLPVENEMCGSDKNEKKDSPLLEEENPFSVETEDVEKVECREEVSQTDSGKDEEIVAIQDTADVSNMELETQQHGEVQAGSDSEEISVATSTQNSEPDEENESSLYDETEERPEDAKNNEDSSPIVQTTSFSKSENGFLHSNGDVKLSGISDPAGPAPPVPARRKKHPHKESEEVSVVSNDSPNDNDQPQGQSLDNDLEKYNGVVEQIIHTGEEKLI